MCSYEGCSNNPVTTLQVDGEEKPACKGHLQTMVDQAQEQEDEEETDGTNYPVASNNEDQAAWINNTGEQIKEKLENNEDFRDGVMTAALILKTEEWTKEIFQDSLKQKMQEVEQQ